MTENCRHRTDQGKNFKPKKGEQNLFQMYPVVEPNEEVQLNFAGPLTVELKKDALNFDCNKKWTKIFYSKGCCKQNYRPCHKLYETSAFRIMGCPKIKT